METLGISPFASAQVSRRVVDCLHYSEYKEVQKMIPCPTARLCMGMRDFMPNFTLLLLLPWHGSCNVCSWMSPYPVRASYERSCAQTCTTLSSCVKVALSHLRCLLLLLIRVRVAKMLFTDGASRIHYMFFIWCTIDFDRSAPWYTCFINRFIVYVDVCEITSRFLFSFSRFITQTRAGMFLWG